MSPIITPPNLVVSADLGKTCSRVAVHDGTGWVGRTVGPGTPGLAAPDAAARTTEIVTRLVGDVIGEGRPIRAIGVGAAGGLAAPDEAVRLAKLLARTFHAPVSVASDVVTAHAGGLPGGVGVCLVAGTGAVALGVAADGTSSLRDGRGLIAGDLGSGAWIGRAGVRRAELAQAGVGPDTVLSDAIPRARAVAEAAGRSPQGAALLARHAPAVLDAAHRGDGQARRIIEDAVAELVATARTAAYDVGERQVVVVGGLTQSRPFFEALRAELASTGLTPLPAAGTALDGGLILALHPELPMKELIHRADPV